jgi:hypothetical protein
MKYWFFFILLMTLNNGLSQSFSKLIDLGFDNQNVVQDFDYSEGELLVLMDSLNLSFDNQKIFMTKSNVRMSTADYAVLCRCVLRLSI